MTTLPGIRRIPWPPLLFLLLACILFWELFAGRVFVPAELLRWLAPWSASAPDARPPWNPLMYDSVGQFYPWRKFAGDTLRSGYLPLWNPYQFCGTPFLANSQSAVLYPLNLLFWLLPAERAAGPSAGLHLLLAAIFTWRLLKDLGAGDGAGAIAGIAYAFSTWQVAWLHLPTFLATSCWLPLLVLFTRRIFAGESVTVRRTRAAAACLAAVTGLCLLAGHLQVAFYALLAAAILAAGMAIGVARSCGAARALRMAALFISALAVGCLLAASQLLPAVELSRQSHRTAPPTPQGYEAYVAYAVSPAYLAAAFVPDYYGSPANPDSPYFGQSRGGMLFNYAEGALYVGMPALLLAAFALVRRRQAGRLIPYFAGLALLALLLALGTPLDSLLYYHVPGFGSSGSPGRALVLWAFGLAVLAGLGYEKAARDEATPVKSALAAIVVTALAGLLCIGVLAGSPPDGWPWEPGLPRQAALAAISALALLAVCAGNRKPLAAAGPILLLIVDLVGRGLLYNRTADAAEVYPPTDLTRALASAGHERIAPINHNWSFAGPKAALPPNAAMVYGLRDVQGYDSLFPGSYKAFMNSLAAPAADASPPEVGNMVFAKNSQAALTRIPGIRFVASLNPLTIPGAREQFLDGVYLYELPLVNGRAAVSAARGEPGSIRWVEDGPTRVRLAIHAEASGELRLADQYYPGWRATVNGQPAPIERDEVFRRVKVPAGNADVEFRFVPNSFRAGLYLALAALAALFGIAASQRAACWPNQPKSEENPNALPAV